MICFGRKMKYKVKKKFGRNPKTDRDMIKMKVQIHRIGKIKVQIKIGKSKLELGRKKNRGQKDSCRKSK